MDPNQLLLEIDFDRRNRRFLRSCAEETDSSTQASTRQRTNASLDVSNALDRSNGSSSQATQSQTLQTRSRNSPVNRERDLGYFNDDTTPALPDPVHLYRNEKPYVAAAGRESRQRSIRDPRDFRSEMAAVDLRSEEPSTEEFLRLISRELKIGGYVHKTHQAYLHVVRSLLRWSGMLPHQIDRESVKDYLLYLVDGDLDSNTVKVHLSAIRTVFDKFCFRDVTLGLVTPRKSKKQAVILSIDEVQRLLQSAISLRDKLLLGLMYATGMRVSEVVRVRWRDVDLQRNLISIVRGKGRVDRRVMLPESYRALFVSFKDSCNGDDFLFPATATRQSGDSCRHLSSRTVQRLMTRTVQIAGISKRATPHSLRHAFATHSFENGCDIRRIQQILGHARLETTTLYVHLAKPADPARMPSPLDSLSSESTGLGESSKAGITSAASRRNGESIPKLRSDDCMVRSRVQVHCKRFAGEQAYRVTLQMHGRECRGSVDGNQNADGNVAPVFLLGVRAKQPRRGLFTLELPPLEHWQKEIAMLSTSDQRLIEEPRFYEFLRRQLPRLIGQKIEQGSDEGMRHSEPTPDRCVARSGCQDNEPNPIGTRGTGTRVIGTRVFETRPRYHRAAS